MGRRISLPTCSSSSTVQCGNLSSAAHSQVSVFSSDPSSCHQDWKAGKPHPGLFSICAENNSLHVDSDRDHCLLLQDHDTPCSARRRSSSHRRCCSCRARREHLKRVEKEVKRTLERELKNTKESNILGNLKAFFAKWLHDSKSGKDLKSGGRTDDMSPTACPATDLEATTTSLVEAVLPAANGYLNLACPQFPQECTETDMQCLHNVISLNSSFDSDYLLHYYTNVSESLCSTGCSTSSIGTTLSTNTTGELLQSCQADLLDSGQADNAVARVDATNWQNQVNQVQICSRVQRRRAASSGSHTRLK